MGELILGEEVYQIIGAAMDVYYQLGRGFLEPVYQEAFVRELHRRRIPHQPQCELNIYYKGEKLEGFYKVDVLCFGEVLTELKALERLGPIEECRIINYLKASRKRVGLLINFGSRVRLEWRRYVL